MLYTVDKNCPILKAPDSSENDTREQGEIRRRIWLHIVILIKYAAVSEIPTLKSDQWAL